MSLRVWTIIAAGSALVASCSSGGPGRGGAGAGHRPGALGAFLQETMPNTLTDRYVIGVGDRLDVVFFFNKDLTTPRLLVRSDGRITLPYVGDVMAAGRTPMQLDSILTDRFGEILRDPNLSVIVQETPDQTVYVLGQVREPGGFPFSGSVSLVQAISLAGGFGDGAKTKHVLVIRRDGLDKIVGVEVNVKDMLKGAAVQNDFLLRNFDIVYVPKSRVQSVADFAQTINQILEPPADLLLRGWQVQVLRQQFELFQDNTTN